LTDRLLSVGIDLGTTTTQMIVSRLEMVNTAAAFSVPNLKIQNREILYRSQIHFTPLKDAERLDAEKIKSLLLQEYELAGIRPEQIQTGAVIITGETARKENARQVLHALSDLAGDFVVATAGPALESVLAARGAGADVYAREHGCWVLHVDIGGGTSNLALFDPEGRLTDTGCLNIGGRLMKFDEAGTVTYVSQVLHGFSIPTEGTRVTPEQLEPLILDLVAVLEEAAGLRPKRAEFSRWLTDKTVELPDETPVISFSGGVADLITGEEDWLAYGDLGVLLGKAIAKSRLCSGSFILGRETMRATVIGAGSYSTELSGSTIVCSHAQFPLQNLPVAALSEEEANLEPEALTQAAAKKLALFEPGAALALRGVAAPSYEQVTRLADGLANALSGTTGPAVVVLEQDMGKALGQALRCRLGRERPLICLDGLHIPEGSYLDLAAPVAEGTAVPVIIKTLAFSS